MKQNVRTICPICDNTDYKNYRNIIKGGYKYNVVRCNNCRFTYILNPKKTTINMTEIN